MSDTADAILSRLETTLRNSSTSSQVAAAVGAIVALYGVKRLFTTSPLALVPGPPSPSLLTGNYNQLMSEKDSVEWGMDVAEKYGGVVKLKFHLGVRLRIRFVWHIAPNVHSLFYSKRYFTSLTQRRSIMFWQKLKHIPNLRGSPRSTSDGHSR
jgi:hypothetical protein